MKLQRVSLRAWCLPSWQRWSAKKIMDRTRAGKMNKARQGKIASGVKTTIWVVRKNATIIIKKMEEEGRSSPNALTPDQTAA